MVMIFESQMPFWQELLRAKFTYGKKRLSLDGDRTKDRDGVSYISSGLLSMK